jgi:DNA-binding FadR family transcriptional regulator
MSSSSTMPSGPSDGAASGSADLQPGAAWLRRPARLGIPVVAALVDQIVGGTLAPGSLLPTEPALAEAFGVSRTVIREAGKLLQEKGLTHVRQGQGTTVAPSEEWNLLDPVVLEAMIRHDESMEILDDLVDVRVALECDMVRAAAKRMTPEDHAALGQVLAELESQLADPVRYQDTDTRYHDLILRCSRNRLGRSIIRSIHPYARASTRYNPLADVEDIRRSHVGHVAVHECLVRGDGDAAAAAMEEHIRGTWTLRKRKRRG